MSALVPMTLFFTSLVAFVIRSLFLLPLIFLFRAGVGCPLASNSRLYLFPIVVRTRVESSTLVFLETRWKVITRQFNLLIGDSLCYRFDGEETLSIRAFDPDGN